MILEGIGTTVGPDGAVNIAPMGPRVDEAMRSLELRPYRTSRTLANLRHLPEGVLHVTDDVLLLAHAAVGRLDPMPVMRSAVAIRGHVLIDACRSYEFHVHRIDDSSERVMLSAEV